MNADILSELSMGGILALLVLREVFGFLRSRMNGGGGGKKGNPHGDRPVTSEVLDLAAKMDRLINGMQRVQDIAAMTQRQAEVNGNAHERMATSIRELDKTLALIDRSVRELRDG